jgi:hypothetical protein
MATRQCDGCIFTMVLRELRVRVQNVAGPYGILRTQSQKMVKIIDEPELRRDIQRRPHVRFNAKILKELEKGGLKHRTTH